MLATEHNSKTKLLDAALRVIRAKGYTSATLDDICTAAGVTKGSYFHHFKSKEEMALLAVEHWNTMTGGLFATAAYQQLADPRDRVLAYIDLRADILQGELPDYTCLLGTMVQELYETNPRIRDACNAGIRGHAATIAADLSQAKVLYVPEADWDPMVIALYTQATIQGAFILAKAQGGPQIAEQCIHLLRRHVASLLGLNHEISQHKELTA